MYRIALRDIIMSAIDKSRKAETSDRNNSAAHTSFSIVSEYEKQQQKLERKERQKKGGVSGNSCIILKLKDELFHSGLFLYLPWYV